MMFLKSTDEFKRLFDIRRGKSNNETIISTISDDVSYDSANVWSLIFSILIASIGLNINSTAVVIGAMLISPLMGPVLGLGVSLSINDSKLLKKSLKNILIAVMVSLVVSTLYFFLSPIRSAQSELLSRSAPTIYDILVAFLGGMIGIIGSTRADRGNIIPGVAIATALMPPLCTAGYGIATAQPQFFFGALYLFLINAIFISFATILGAKFLKLPLVKDLEEEEAKKNRRRIAFVSVVMLIPAIYFATLLIGRTDFDRNADRFIQDNFAEYTVIYRNVVYDHKPHLIELALLTKRFNQEELDTFQNLLLSYKLKNTSLVIKQDENTLTQNEWDSVILNLKNDSDRLAAMETMLNKNVIAENEAVPQILKEAQSINSQVYDVAIGAMSLGDTTTSPHNSSSTIALFYIYANSGTSSTLSVIEQHQLSDWIKKRVPEISLVYFLPYVDASLKERSASLGGS